MDLQSHYRLSDLCRGEAGVDLGAGDRFVAEKGGDGVYVHAIFQKTHSECVSKTVEGYVLLNLGEFEESGNVETQFITRQIGKHQASLLRFAELFNCRRG